MPEYIARKPLVVNGKEYATGKPVPLDRMPEKVRRQLVEQRRVVPNEVRIQGGRKEG